MSTEDRPLKNRSDHRVIAYVGLIAAILGVYFTLAQQESRDFICAHTGFLCPQITLGEPPQMRFYAWPPPAPQGGPLTRPCLPTLDAMIEAADIPFDQRTYTDRFQRGAPQRTFWELLLKSYRPPGRPIDFEVYVSIYRKSDGNPVHGHAEKGHWNPNDPGAVAAGYLFDDDPCAITWPQGVYETVLTITGKGIAETRLKRDFSIE